MGFVISTPPGDVAFSIALGVLLLSIVLEPIVRGCFHRIRADRAWRSLQKREAVDVTRYGFFSEALGDRGKWDTARIVTFMVAAFHISTWGLELSLSLAIRTDGPVDLLNRPPPIISGSDVGDNPFPGADWVVLENQEPITDGGTFGNLKGTLVDGYATALYRIGDNFISGSTVIASWSANSSGSSSKLFYDEGKGYAKTKGIGCLTWLRSGDIYIESETGSRERWGTATECDSGPEMLNASIFNCESPPTILLNGTGDTGERGVYLIVEEASSYPSFLYSVWKPVGADMQDETELHHLFYVSSNTRMAEAVVSTIVNGFLTGGECVDSLARFSASNVAYNLSGKARISPFGEYPRASFVASIDEVESIVAGVEVSAVGTLCAIMLICVTGTAFVGCLCCFTRSPLDVYDRDALIRTVSLPRGVGDEILPAAPKIFIRQKGGNSLGVIVTDEGISHRCGSLRNRLSEILDASPVDEGEKIPTRRLSRSWSLPAASDREITRRANQIRDRSHCRASTFVELVLSPVPGITHQNSFLRGPAAEAFEDLPLPTGTPKLQEFTRRISCDGSDVLVQSVGEADRPRHLGQRRPPTVLENNISPVPKLRRQTSVLRSSAIKALQDLDSPQEVAMVSLTVEPEIPALANVIALRPGMKLGEVVATPTEEKLPHLADIEPQKR